MKNQKDKGILQIDYNFLNLPKEVKFDATYIIRNKITGESEERNVRSNYLYRADGTKLKKKYTYFFNKGNAERITTTDYLDDFQYTTNYSGVLSLDFVPTSEGYFDFVKNKYIYNYADHLGNTRLSYFHNGSSIEVLEENNYYPFGLKHEGYNALAGNTNYNYKYNGKELQEETGMYDYGARFYMPDIGRWGVIDPLAEQNRAWTPYRYAYNNPLRFTDPGGRIELTALGDMMKSGSGFSNDDGSSFVSDTFSSSFLTPTLSWNTDPKPTFWQKVENFFSSLFRGKNKQADVLPITGAAARPIYVGQLEKVGRVLTLEEVGAVLGTIMGKSVWALPLMLNGDSSSAKGYDIPLTGATDVPDTVVDNKREQTITLYRGVHGQHPDLANAYLGMAIPWGGSATAYQHNMGDNNSMYTS